MWLPVCFYDMPVVNIGTASNLFHAVEECLGKHDLDFSKVWSFMSNTTHEIKGVQSGVQKAHQRQESIYV